MNIDSRGWRTGLWSGEWRFPWPGISTTTKDSVMDIQWLCSFFWKQRINYISWTWSPPVNLLQYWVSNWDTVGVQSSAWRLCQSMVKCLVVGCLLMTAFVLSIISHPRNNLFKRGLKPRLIKVEEDCCNTMILERYSKCIVIKRKEKGEAEKMRKYFYSECCTSTTCFIACRLFMHRLVRQGECF